MKFLSNPTTQIVMFICTLLAIPSIILAIIFHLKSRHKLELSYAKYSYSLIEQNKAISKLKIIFDNLEVEGVTISKFAIWNSGHESIRQSDNVFINPLRLYCQNGATILDASIVCETDKDNMYTVDQVSENECHISMKYMDQNDGCIIQVIHTGKVQDVLPDCKLIGGKRLKNIQRNISNSYGFMDKISPVIIFFLLSFCLFHGVFTGKTESIFETVSSCILGILCIFIGIRELIQRFQIGIPKKLKSYCEDV